MAIELNTRTKIMAGVVVLAAAGAGAWFFFLEDFLSEPPPKPAAVAAKDAPGAASGAAEAAPAAGAPGKDASKGAAAAPKPGAKPIPDNPDRLIAEVLDLSGVDDYFKILAREAMLKAAGDGDQKAGMESRALVAAVDAAFDPAKLNAEIAANLKGSNPDLERMARFLELLRQPIVAKMVAPELRDVTPEAMKEHAESARKNPPVAARVKLVQTLDDVTQSSDVGSDLSVALARDQIDATLESMKKPGKEVPGAARQQVTSRMSVTRDQARSHIRTVMYVMYRKASDEDLAEYVKLLDTDTGRWGGEQLANAIRPLVVARAGALGREAAKMATAKPAGRDAAPQASAQQEEKPAQQASAAPATPPQPSYQRPANIRDVYTRYNDVISATVMRDTAAVKELLDDGKSPNARQSDGMTALMVAAANGDTEIAQMLLSKGADVNAKSGSRSALSVAKSRGSAGAGMVQLLQRSGAKE